MVKRTTVLIALTLALASAGCRRTAEKPADASGEPKNATTTNAAEARPESKEVEVGSAMPAYVASWLDGSRFDLAERKGRVVLLNVWATWCPPCRYEIPELQRLHDKYRESNFEVVGVSVDEGGVDEVRNFVAEKKMTYPIVLDPEGKLTVLLQTSVLPTSVLLDRDGKVVWKHYGAVFENDAELEKALHSAIAAK